MKLSFMSTSRDASDSIYIRDDDDVSAFLMDRNEKNCRGSLQVEFIKKDENDEQVQLGANTIGLDDLEDELHNETNLADHD